MNSTFCHTPKTQLISPRNCPIWNSGEGHEPEPHRHPQWDSALRVHEHVKEWMSEPTGEDILLTTFLTSVVYQGGVCREMRTFESLHCILSFCYVISWFYHMSFVNEFFNESLFKSESRQELRNKPTPIQIETDSAACNHWEQFDVRVKYTLYSHMCIKY